MSEELQQENETVWYQTLGLPELKNIIKDNIGIAGRSFVTIGYYLKNVRDRELFLEDGYQSIWEFAQGEFGIGKSSASQFMSINDKFSKDGNSPILLDQYKDFSSSKLAEMLTLSDEQLEQITPTTTIVEIRKIKKPEIKTVLMSEQAPKPSGQCIHRPEFPCTLPEASKLAQGNGEDCNAKCCWSCPKHGQCGYECNSSAHRPDVNDIPEPANNTPKNVDKEPETVNDVDQGVIETSESVTKEQATVSSFAQGDEDAEQVEIVEADIVKTVPEELPKPIFSAEYHLKEAIKREEDQLKQLGETWLIKQPDTYLKHQTILIAMKCHLTDMEYPNPEPVKPVQPELPILKNNDQRQEWVNNYKAWGEWYHDENIDCHYYKYDFPNEDRLIVEEYLNRPSTWEKKNHDEHHYHLLRKEKQAYGSKWTYEQKYEHSTSSMTEIVDYLKEIQKKG